tara:strand:+ start:1533 stop:2543 length:1011 start_codon:yes stop_codon:yes gene_type:complete
MNLNIENTKMFFNNELFPRHTNTSITIVTLYNGLKDKSITFDHRIQRNQVWNNIFKQRYLETISKQGPLHSFVLNFSKKDSCYYIIDGQNRALTIKEFMDDEFTFKNNNYNIKYSELSKNEKFTFNNIKISFVETDNWNDHFNQLYFNYIQDGIKLSDGEIIHSQINNPFRNKIKELCELYKDLINKLKIKNNRFKEFEIFGCILKIIHSNTYYSRPGKTTKNELKKWNDNNINELTESIKKFKTVINFYINLYDGCDLLTKKRSPAIFIRNIYFILINNIFLSQYNSNIQNKFNKLMEVVLTDGTDVYKDIINWGTKGQINEIMSKYKEIYDRHN